MGTMRELVRFYGKDMTATEDEAKLASAAKGLSEEREAASAMAKAEDRVDIQEHIRRYHGGKLEPGESCPFLEKLKKAEEDFGTLDPKDADGDGESDFAEEEDKEKSEAEDSADAVKAYFEAVAKDEFREDAHPRTAKGGKGGGQFAKKPETLAKEDQRDVLDPDDGSSGGDAAKTLVQMSNDAAEGKDVDLSGAHKLIEETFGDDLDRTIRDEGPTDLALRYEGDGSYLYNGDAGSRPSGFAVTYSDLGLDKKGAVAALSDWFFEQDDPAAAIKAIKTDTRPGSKDDSLLDSVLWERYGKEWQGKYPDGKRKKPRGW